jgi:hypothetical protein
MCIPPCPASRRISTVCRGNANTGGGDTISLSLRQHSLRGGKENAYRQRSITKTQKRSPHRQTHVPTATIRLTTCVVWVFGSEVLILWDCFGLRGVRRWCRIPRCGCSVVLQENAFDSLRASPMMVCRPCSTSNVLIPWR